MPETKQITVRAVKKSSYERLKEVREVSGLPLGKLLDEAIEFWWENLPEAEVG